MTKQEVFSEFRTIKKNDSYQAFDFLYSNLPLSTFIREGIKKPRKTKESCVFDNPVFWDEFILEENRLAIFCDSIDSNLFDDLLFWYFSRKDLVSEKFIKKLGECSLKDLIKSVRVTQAFLNKETLDILLKLDLGSELSVHQNTWKYLYDKDSIDWVKISESSKEWSSVSSEDFLGNLINWLEIKRHADDSDENLNHLALAYNFIISFYLSENYSKCKSIDEFKLYKGFSRSFSQPNKDIFNSFDLISHWVWWSSAVLEPYSFDLNCKPIFKDERFGFEYYNDKEFKDWQINGTRYFLNILRYKKTANAITKYLIQEKKVSFPPKKSEEEHDNNVELFSLELASLNLVVDLCLDKIKINGKEIETENILKPLLGYSFNRITRYERGLDKLRSNSNSWQWSFFQLNEFCKTKDIDCFPYFFMTKEKYISHNLQASTPDQQNVFKEIIKQFSYPITERYKFNRHRIGYEVWHTPFVTLGDYLFCPMLFFARNEWFYSLAQVIIKNYDKYVDLRKPTSVQMEKKLKEVFKTNHPNWDVLIPEFKHDGDIDLILSDGEVDLLIQLKRTYLRTNLKDAYFESVTSDRKAINQLLNAESFLKKNSDVYDLKSTCYKWLVSTSFENINKVYDGCKKLNYLELIWALEHQKFQNIEELKSYMYNDKILKVR